MLTKLIKNFNIIFILFVTILSFGCTSNEYLQPSGKTIKGCRGALETGNTKTGIGFTNKKEEVNIYIGHERQKKYDVADKDILQSDDAKLKRYDRYLKCIGNFSSNDKKDELASDISEADDKHVVVRGYISAKEDESIIDLFNNDWLMHYNLIFENRSLYDVDCNLSILSSKEYTVYEPIEIKVKINKFSEVSISDQKHFNYDKKTKPSKVYQLLCKGD